MKNRNLFKFLYNRYLISLNRIAAKEAISVQFDFQWSSVVNRSSTLVYAENGNPTNYYSASENSFDITIDIVFQRKIATLSKELQVALYNCEREVQVYLFDYMEFFPEPVTDMHITHRLWRKLKYGFTEVSSARWGKLMPELSAREKAAFKWSKNLE